MLYIMHLLLLRNIHLLIFFIKVLYASYSHSLSKVESRNGLMHLRLNPFTHGNRSWIYIYFHIRTMTMMKYVIKLNLLKEKERNPFLTSIRGFYGTIIDFMTIINHQIKSLIDWVYILFIIPFQKLSNKYSLVNLILLSLKNFHLNSPPARILFHQMLIHLIVIKSLLRHLPLK